MNLDLATRLRTASGVQVAHGPADAAPQSIEGYELRERIECGGQGAVWKARQQATNRDVAVKVLLAGAYATEAQRQRFEREIELVASLDHPNVVAVHDSGRTVEGWPFLAMQYLDGKTLDLWLDGGPDRERKLAVFCEVCSGVAHAHRRGVLHRDLKPQNVIVDGEDRARVVDFGLARPLAANPGSDVTRPDAVLGTLAYAAPEQLAGAATDVDTRADVFALGVMLYEMLTGRPPQVMGSGLESVIAAKRTEVPLLRARDIDSDLATIVSRALAVDPDRRYASAQELLDDVDRYRRGAPIMARADSTWYLLRRSLYRFRVPVAVAGAFVILLVVFVGVLARMYQQAKTDADKVRQVNIFLEDTLGSIGEGGAAGDVTVSELLDESVEWIDLALGSQPDVAASMHHLIGNSYRGLGRFEDADVQLQRALSLRRAVLGEDDLQVAQSLMALGLLRREEERFEESESFMRRALTIREDRLGSDDPQVAGTLANLAILAFRQGNVDDAESLYERALVLRRAELGDDHPDVAMCLFRLGEFAEAKGDVGRARRLHEEALAIRTRQLHPGHPDVARSTAAVERLR